MNMAAGYKLSLLSLSSFVSNCGVCQGISRARAMSVRGKQVTQEH